jgi:hypothetical protein
MLCSVLEAAASRIKVMSETPVTGNEQVDAVLASIDAQTDAPLSEQLPVLTQAQEALAAILDAPSSADPQEK